MSTLLLRLSGPLQSWGVASKFDRRDTRRIPTKSGVIGLAAAALGRRRDESLEDLVGLRFGVRVERDGVLLRDFHTAKSLKSAYVTYRYYLSDACFLAGLEGPPELLGSIERALWCPAFPLFLGRRSCPPEGRISLGIRAGLTLEEALEREPFLTLRGQSAATRIYLETAPGTPGASMYRDLPLSLNQTRREYGFRFEIERRCQKTSQPQGPEGNTSHDPFEALEG